MHAGELVPLICYAGMIQYNYVCTLNLDQSQEYATINTESNYIVMIVLCSPQTHLADLVLPIATSYLTSSTVPGTPIKTTAYRGSI